MSEKETLTPNEAAQLAGVHPQTIYTWLRNGKLKAKKVFGRIKIDRTYFINWIKENTENLN